MERACRVVQQHTAPWKLDRQWGTAQVPPPNGWMLDRHAHRTVCQNTMSAVAALCGLPGELVLEVVRRAAPSVPTLGALAAHSRAGAGVVARVLAAEAQWAWLYRAHWGAKREARAVQRNHRLGQRWDGWRALFQRELRRDFQTCCVADTLQMDMRERTASDAPFGGVATEGGVPPLLHEEVLQSKLVYDVYTQTHGQCTAVYRQPKGLGKRCVAAGRRGRRAATTAYENRLTVWLEDWRLIRQERAEARARLARAGFVVRQGRLVPAELGVAAVLLRCPERLHAGGPIRARDLVDELTALFTRQRV